MCHGRVCIINGDDILFNPPLPSNATWPITDKLKSLINHDFLIAVIGWRKRDINTCNYSSFLFYHQTKLQQKWLLINITILQYTAKCQTVTIKQLMLCSITGQDILWPIFQLGFVAEKKSRSHFTQQIKTIWWKLDNSYSEFVFWIWFTRIKLWVIWSLTNDFNVLIAMNVWNLWVQQIRLTLT